MGPQQARRLANGIMYAQGSCLRFSFAGQGGACPPAGWYITVYVASQQRREVCEQVFTTSTDHQM